MGSVGCGPGRGECLLRISLEQGPIGAPQMDQGIVGSFEQTRLDDFVDSLGIGEHQELRLEHCGVDPVRVEAMGLTVVEHRVLRGEHATCNFGDLEVDLRVLRLKLERAAVFDQCLIRLLLLEILLRACDVLRKPFLGRSASPGQRDREQGERSPGRQRHGVSRD